MLVVRPAYGRKHNSVRDARSWWEAEKDFQIVGQTAYINKTDWLKYAPHQNVVIQIHNTTHVLQERLPG